MPNRIIKESICTSDKISQLSHFEFRLWVGLIVTADDAGRGDARPAVIKGRVFPLFERLTNKDIEASLANLAAKGCISLYEVDEKPYFLFPSWSKHQRIRDSKPKYPEPPENDNPPQVAASCGELPQVAAIIQSNTIQSESNPTRACAQEFESDELNEAWEDYIAMRKEIEKPLTETARKRALNKLKSLAEPYNDKERYMLDCLNQSITNCWQGLFEVKEFVDGKAKLPPPPPFDPNASIEERLGLHFD